MKPATILAVVAVVAAAVATAPGVNADRNPISNHAHTEDHSNALASNAFQSANTKVAFTIKSNRALRVVDEPKQKPSEGGKHHDHRDHQEPKRDDKQSKRGLTTDELELINALTLRKLGQSPPDRHDGKKQHGPLLLKEDPNALKKHGGRALGQAPVQNPVVTPAATTTSSSNVTPAPTTANKPKVTPAVTTTSKTSTTVATKPQPQPTPASTTTTKTAPSIASSTSATKATKGTNVTQNQVSKGSVRVSQDQAKQQTHHDPKQDPKQDCKQDPKQDCKQDPKHDCKDYHKPAQNDGDDHKHVKTFIRTLRQVDGSSGVEPTGDQIDGDISKFVTVGIKRAWVDHDDACSTPKRLASSVKVAEESSVSVNPAVALCVRLEEYPDKAQ